MKQRGSQTYSTRHLTADPLRPPSGTLSAPVRAAPEPAAATIDGLRAEAERLGIAVDRRWGVMRLQYAIAKARKG